VGGDFSFLAFCAEHEAKRRCRAKFIDATQDVAKAMGVWLHWVFALASIEIDVTSAENVCKEWQSMVSLVRRDHHQLQAPVLRSRFAVQRGLRIHRKHGGTHL